jgi:hypothetical protein
MSSWRGPGKFTLLVLGLAAATLKEKGRMSKLFNNKLADQRLPNYLRVHRRGVGLHQKELSTVLGYLDDGPVSRHERFQATPSLLVALGYEVIYRVPVSEIFAGLRDQVEGEIEERLGVLEIGLQQRHARERGAAAIARKLEWLCERRELGSI